MGLLILCMLHFSGDIMKKNIIKGLVFVSLLLLTISFVIQVCPSDDNKEKRVKGYKNEETTLDVMAYGNSDLYSGFIPSLMYDEYGYTSYNCGRSKAGMYDVYNYLVESFNYQHPQLVMIETDILTYPSRRKKDNKAVRRVYRNHDFWRQSSSKEIIDMKGYVYSSKVVPYKEEENQIEKKNRILKKNFIILSEMKEFCDKNDVELLLVEMPSVTTWSQERHDDVVEYANENNIKFIDFNYLDEVGIDLSTDSRDGGNHLNINGAMKTTRYISKYISENYSITPSGKNESFEKASKILKDKMNKDKKSESTL